jgi:hypothetical protein
LAKSRKRRKPRHTAPKSQPPRLKGSDPLSEGDSRGLTPNGGEAPRGYARSRAKDDAARAALKPLARGERPTAVTVGAIVALVLAAGNLVGIVAISTGWDPPGGGSSGQALALSILGAGLMLAIAWGMWRSRYWAVLGMQTVLALTLISSALAIVTAANAFAILVLLVTIAAAGTLFWFMVKAMARIQMPERPSRSR